MISKWRKREAVLRKAAFGLSLVGALAAGEGALAATYYVSTTGSNSSSGSASAPFRTINYAYGRAVAGDTIIVKPGRYTDSYGPELGLWLNKNGTASAPIVVKSEVRGGAIIDGENSSYRYRGVLINGSYNILHGFRITNGFGEGIGVYRARNNYIMYCEIDHNGNVNPAPSGGHTGLYTAESSSNNLYYGNVAHDNGNPASTSKGHGFYGSGVSNERYLNNVAYNNAGFGIQMASYQTIRSMIVAHNTVYNNAQGGIVLWSPSAPFVSATVKNNIITNHSRAAIFLYQANGSGVEIDSNLAYANGSGNLTQTGSSLSYTSTRWINANPLFVGSLDFHINTGSPAIDRAAPLSITLTTDHDGVARPQGAANDIGAYEFRSGAGTRVNLVKNPSFESGLANWSNWGNSGTVSSAVFDGAASLRSGTGSGGIGQVVSGVRAGAAYALKFAAKMGSASDLGGFVGIEFYDASNRRIAARNLNVRSTAWTNFTISGVAPSVFSYAMVYTWKNTGASYLFVDRISLN